MHLFQLKHLLISVTLVLATLHPAFASNAELLLKSCDPQDLDSDVQTFYRSGCIFFIRGVMSAHDTFVGIKRIKPIYCTTKALTFSSVEKIFINWTELNRDKLDWTAADAVYAALAESFPCDQENADAQQAPESR